MTTLVASRWLVVVDSVLAAAVCGIPHANCKLDGVLQGFGVWSVRFRECRDEGREKRTELGLLRS